ncbi:hypothetical protein GF325_17200 [Candidatus Bathyarchaeota archaeon]|nr:hypothetical protein [Candidatus Bathyarchaeota archaeon]
MDEILTVHIMPDNDDEEIEAQRKEIKDLGLEDMSKDNFHRLMEGKKKPVPKKKEFRGFK